MLCQENSAGISVAGRPTDTPIYAVVNEKTEHRWGIIVCERDVNRPSQVPAERRARFGRISVGTEAKTYRSPQSPQPRVTKRARGLGRVHGQDVGRHSTGDTRRCGWAVRTLAKSLTKPLFVAIAGLSGLSALMSCRFVARYPSLGSWTGLR